MTTILIFGLCVNAFDLPAHADGPVPNVRLRNGIIERFDWNEFRYKPTGSRFIPIRPKNQQPAEPKVKKPQPAERFMRILPKSEGKRPQKPTIPGLFDA
jgi:hypothetical protein